MADYFDRLVERARDEGIAAIAARPPARAIFDPYQPGADPVVPAGEDFVESGAGAEWESLEPRTSAGVAPPTVAAPADPVSAERQADGPSARSRAADAPSASAAAADPPPFVPAPSEERPPTPARATIGSVDPDHRETPRAPTSARSRTPVPSTARGPLDARPLPAAVETARADQVVPAARWEAKPEPAGPIDPRSRIRPATGLFPPPSPALPPSETGAPPPPPQTVVRVSIGRVEVRAPTPERTRPQPSPAAPAGPRLTLDAYLERANQRRRR